MKTTILNGVKTPSIIMMMLGLLLLNPLISRSAVLIKDKQWQKGTVLNVVFLDGSLKLHQLVKKIAPQWLNKTSLAFHFFSDPDNIPKQTHIRISFELHNGSQLGNHQDYESKYATMNLFDLSLGQISDSQAQRLILHEFGHALGFEHEYRNSDWPYGGQAIERIILDCFPNMVLIGYSEQAAVKHCQKINAPIDSSQAHLTAYDERSIMNYPMSFIRQDGSSILIKPAFTLSILDFYAIQRWYGL